MVQDDENCRTCKFFRFLKVSSGGVVILNLIVK